MGDPINRAPLTAAQTNLVNGEVSDGPILEAAVENLYDYSDTKNAEINAHLAATTLPHADGSVTGPKLASSSVTDPKLATGAVLSRALAANSVITEKIANQNITEPKMANNAVSSRTIQQAAVLGVHLDPSLTSQISDIAIQAKFQQIDFKFSNSDKTIRYVEEFGAVGNGIADDTTAITQAIQYCATNGVRELRFNKIYRVNNTINITGYNLNVSTEGLTLKSQDGLKYRSCIIANTGGELFRFTDCERFNFELNIISTLCPHYTSSYFSSLIDPSERNGCSIAYVVTRGAGGTVGSGLFTYKGYIELEHNDSFNGGYGTICLYCDTAEVQDYTNMWYTSDTPIILTSADLLNITDNTYSGSCKDHYFHGRCVLQSHGYGHACIVADGIDGLKMSVYANARNYNDNNSFLKVNRYVQNFEIFLDGEGVSQAVTGNSLAYGTINVYGTQYSKLFTVKNLSNVTVRENANFRSGYTFVMIDQPVLGQYMNCDFYFSSKPSKAYAYNNGWFGSCRFHLVNMGNHIDFLSIVTSANTQRNVFEVYDYIGHYNQDNRSISWLSGTPATIGDEGVGTVKINVSAVINPANNQPGYPAFSVFNGTNYSYVGQHGYRTVTTTNLATTAPRFRGEFIIDQNKKLYMGLSTTAGDWTV